MFGSHYYAFQNKVTGAQFYTSSQHHDGKIHVGVRLPNSWKVDGYWPTVRNEAGDSVARPTAIKMNPDKSPAKMALDFRNRLEVEGTDFFIKSLEALDKEANDAKNRLDNRKNIAKALGAEWMPYFAEHNITTKVQNVHVVANITTSNNVELTLSYLTVEQAQNVIALLTILKG